MAAKQEVTEAETLINSEKLKGLKKKLITNHSLRMKMHQLLPNRKGGESRETAKYTRPGIARSVCIWREKGRGNKSRTIGGKYSSKYSGSRKSYRMDLLVLEGEKAG